MAVNREEAIANPQEYLGKEVFLNASNDLVINAQDDLATVKYTNNLSQAIISRLKTNLGELSEHPNYGSRLNELIGTNANSLSLTLAKMHVFEALLQEPRIEEILEISPRFRENTSNSVIDIYIKIKPIRNLTELNMIYSLFI